MKDPIKINIYPYHFETKDNKLIVWGNKKEKKYDAQRYEVHIHLENNGWFSMLARELKERLYKKIEDIKTLIDEI